jgi:hypothetical protein
MLKLEDPNLWASFRPNTIDIPRGIPNFMLIYCVHGVAVNEKAVSVFWPPGPVKPLNVGYRGVTNSKHPLL